MMASAKYPADLHSSNFETACSKKRSKQRKANQEAHSERTGSFQQEGTTENTERDSNEIGTIREVRNVFGLKGLCKVDSKTIPFVRRFDKNQVNKYVLGSVAEKLFFNQYSSYFTEEFAKCVIVPKFAIRDKELKTFNVINNKHFKNALSSTPFTGDEELLLLDDVIKLTEFLKLSYEMIFEKKKDNGRFGFMRINDEDPVPFVRCNRSQFIPLMYFDGCQNLSNFGYISDRWQLNYLRLCFKIQKINESRYNDMNSIKVVELNDIGKLFPESTRFETHLPLDINEKLIEDQVAIRASSSTSKEPRKSASSNRSNVGSVDSNIETVNTRFKIIYPKLPKSSDSDDPVSQFSEDSNSAAKISVKRKKSKNPNLRLTIKPPKFNNPTKSDTTSENVRIYPTPASCLLQQKKLIKNEQIIEEEVPTENSPSEIKEEEVIPMQDQPSENSTEIEDECIEIQDEPRENLDQQILANVVYKKKRKPIQNLPANKPQIQENFEDVFARSKSIKKLRLHLREKTDIPIYRCDLKNGPICYVISLTQLLNSFFPAKWPCIDRFINDVKPYFHNTFKIKASTYPYHRAVEELDINAMIYASIFAVCSNITDVDKACAYLDLIEYYKSMGFSYV